MKIKISKKSIPKILLGTIYLAMRSNFNKSDKGLLIKYNSKTFINHSPVLASDLPANTK